MEKKFLENIIDIFEDENELSLDTKFSDLENWDSLKKLTLLSVVDENYGIMINNIENMSSFRDIYNVFVSK